MRRALSIVIVALCGGVLMGCAAMSGQGEAAQTPAPGAERTPANNGAPKPVDPSNDRGEQRLIYDVQVGQCFSLPDDAGQNSAILTVTVYPSCESPHQYEAFATGQVEGETYPGKGEVDKQVDAFCSAQFASFTSDRSAFDYTAISPSEDSWRSGGDRQILCLATSKVEAVWTGSAGK